MQLISIWCDETIQNNANEDIWSTPATLYLLLQLSPSGKLSFPNQSTPAGPAGDPDCLANHIQKRELQNQAKEKAEA